MSNLREFLQLAHTFDGSQNIGGWMYSSKLDGWRCWWDGGVTRGMDTKDIPFANTAKESRYITIPKATGLWSRYGRPIIAPDWWLDDLPDFPLDGELWMGRNSFQRVMSVTKSLIPGMEWVDVNYMVFDCPSYREVFADGEIRNKGRFEKKFADFYRWMIGKAKTKDPKFLTSGKTFSEAYDFLRENVEGAYPRIRVLLQRELPYNPAIAKKAALEAAINEVESGGEGIIVRMADSFWTPKRSRQMLKIKPYNDAEGLVIGYTWGERTDLGSKLLGLMGSIIVMWNGKKFKLSGFTEEERQMTYQGDVGSAFAEGCKHPGEIVAENYTNSKFPLGTLITFRYRELSEDGIPKEARYHRIAKDKQ